MIDCSNAEMRDRLPDLASERLEPVEHARVSAHVAGCTACAADVELIRAARAVRPRPVAINVAAITARLPKSAAAQSPGIVAGSAKPDLRLASSPKRRVVTSKSSPAFRSKSVWRVAAAIGIVIVGGGSVVIARSGSVPSVATLIVDSARSGGLTESGVSASDIASTTDLTPATVKAVSSVAVSYGNVGDYTEEELAQVLERLEKWDGATSTETMTTTPIMPVPKGGTDK